MAKRSSRSAKATKTAKAPNAAKSGASAARPKSLRPSDAKRSSPKLTDSGIARAQARLWADQARSGSARSIALHGDNLAAAIAGGDRRLAEFCMELLADLPAPVLFTLCRDQLTHGNQERRWALAQTLALAFQKKPRVETTDLAERCLTQALGLLGSARLAAPQPPPAPARRRRRKAKQPRDESTDVFISQAILWLETMNGSAIWQQPTERMTLLAQKISTAALHLPTADQDNLRTVLLRLIAGLPDLWAEELMIDALDRAPWTAFAAIEALRAHPGPRVDAALYSTLERQPPDASPIVIKALYAALTERQPVDLLPALFARLPDCPPARLAMHVALVAACTQAQPALAAQAARATPAALKRLFAVPVRDGAYAAYHACEIISRVGDAAHADALAALANRFVGSAGFEMVAFACSRTLRQWVGPDKARRLLRDRVGSQIRKAVDP